MIVRLSVVLALAVAAAACSKESVTEQRPPANAVVSESAQAYTSRAMLDLLGPRTFESLPASLKLTDAQLASLKALDDAFFGTHPTEFGRIRSALQSAHEALRAGKDPDKVQADLDAIVQPIMESLRPELAQLGAARLSLFTPEQRAWILAQLPLPPGKRLGP